MNGGWDVSECDLSEPQECRELVRVVLLMVNVDNINSIYRGWGMLFSNGKSNWQSC